MLDRIDLQVEVPRISYQQLSDTAEPESSATIRLRVEAARQIQRERFAGSGTICNAAMKPRQIRQFCVLDEAGQKRIKMVTDRLGFSARTYTHLLKVARTIADLAESEHVRHKHLAEAIQYRSLDRRTQ